MVDLASDLAPAWAKVLEELGTDPRIESTDKTWLWRVRPMGMTHDTALLAAPSDHAKGVLEGRLLLPLAVVLAGHFGRKVRIAVIVDSGHAGDTRAQVDKRAADVQKAPDPEQGEDIHAAAVRAARDAETALQKLTPGLLTQLRKNDPRSADMLVGLLFRTATLAAGG